MNLQLNVCTMHLTGTGYISLSTGEELTKDKEMMEKYGFTMNENDSYVMDGYGLFVSNLAIGLTELNKINHLVHNAAVLGYDFVIGPGVPSSNGIVYNKGLYLKNYKEIMQNDNRNIPLFKM